MNIAHVNLNNLKFNSNQPKWEFLQITNKWKPPKNANDKQDLFKMPQHKVNLYKTSDDDRSLIVSLNVLDCKNPNAIFSFYCIKLNRKKSKSIGLTFSINNFDKKDLKKVAKTNEKLVTSGEICKRLIVTNEAYIIVPYISDLSSETTYVLRIVYENVNNNNSDSDNDEEELEDYELVEGDEESEDEDDANDENKKNNKQNKKKIIYRKSTGKK